MVEIFISGNSYTIRGESSPVQCRQRWTLAGPLCVFVTDREDNESSAGVYWDTGGHWGDNATRHLLSPYKGQLTDSLLFCVFLTICINLVYLLELVRTFQLKISTQRSRLIFTLSAFTAENSWKLGREHIWVGI